MPSPTTRPPSLRFGAASAWTAGLLCAGLIASAVIYTSRLDQVPAYLTLDEAHFSVHADAIARTGRNLNGQILPPLISLEDPEGEPFNLPWGTTYYLPFGMYLIAGALKALGTTHALVVHGEPGLDEISPLGPTHVVEIRDGRMSEWTIEPAHFGMRDGRAEELAGGPPATNASAVRAALSGDAPPTARAAVLLNAAAAIFVSTIGTERFGDAVEVARAALDDGAGLAALERLRRAFQSAER